ncbi:MAG: class I SAM-dependent methyltransferase [Gammaproteobacteria bacterium]|nr:class I SAM-dependent methyltransferase [Gammaproteobacteria bacterium]
MTTAISVLEYINSCIKKEETDLNDIESFEYHLSKLEELGSHLLFKKFQAKGFFESNTFSSLEEAQKNVNVLPKYNRILASLFELFIRHGYIVEADNKKYKLNINLTLNIDDILKNLKNMRSINSEISSNASLLTNVIDSYFEILSGEKSIFSCIFPDGSLEVIEKIYKESPDAKYFNIWCANILRYYSDFMSKAQNSYFSIIELGAGIGSTTEHLLNQNINYSNYTYTDISRAFLNHGARSFKHDFIKFKILNIDNDSQLQGFKEKYDIVVATNVLHAAKNIEETLKTVRNLLNKNGIFIINDGVDKRDFSTLAYGLLDGWWTFEDPHWRIDDSPFITRANWNKLLHSAGFTHVTSVNEITKPALKLLQDVIIAL